MTDQKSKWIAVGNTFCDPYWAPEVEIIRPPIQDLRAAMLEHRDAVCLYSMNTGPWGNINELSAGAAIAREEGLPSVWWTVEDPNHLSHFMHEAMHFDIVFTSDRFCVQAYIDKGKSRVAWLPLACQPAIHQPAPLAEDAVDLVHIANHYPYPSKQAALDHLLLPLVRVGWTLALYSNEDCPWPGEIKRWQREQTSCFDVAKFYPQGKVALGSNCQMTKTTMTSMRTYEVLACGKPFVAYHSDAYPHLGFVNGQHFAWVRTGDQAIEAVRLLLRDPQVAAEMAERGRQFVLEHHTYALRAEYVEYVIGGGTEALSFEGAL